jgi:predicted PurR-regulated permease PerM
MPQPIAFNRQRLVQAFFFVTFGFLLYQLFHLARPFLPGMLGAGMLALAFSPLYSWTKKTVRNSNLAALLMTIVVTLLAVLPLVITGFVLVQEADKLIPTIQNYLGALKEGDLQAVAGHLPPAFQTPMERVLSHMKESGINLEPMIMNQIQSLGHSLISLGRFSARKFIFGIMNALVLLVSLFFAFRDGESLFEWVLSLLPMEEAHKRAIARRAYETFRAVAIGVSVTAAAQGFLAMIGFLIAGVKLPVLLGLATVISSFLGASWLVTLPVALFVLSHNTFWGVFLLFWGLVMVGLLDNLLKPILIGSRARMSFFLILFSIIGGVKAYGFLGFILGPVLVASLLTFIKIYREEYNR